MTLKVGCIIHSLDGGGAERVMASLCSRLAARGHLVTLITLDDGQRERHKVDAAVTRKRLSVMSNSRGWMARVFHTHRRVRRVRQAIVETDPDVVLSFCDRTNILTLMSTKGLSLPVIVCERSDPSQQQLGRIWEWLRDRTYRRAAAIVALTESAADSLRSRFSVPIEVIPSAVDVPPFVSDRDAAQREKRILSIGRLEYEKGFDRLLTAFAPLAAECDQWSLRIVGEGSMRTDLELRIDQLRLRNRVELPGWSDRVWEELAAATFFVLPSRYEGFPSALMEAMAMGVPSLAVDCPSGPRAVLLDPSWGLLVPNDIDSLAAGMRRMMEQPEFRERFAAAGRQVLQHFNWDAMTDRYEALLERYGRDR